LNASSESLIKKALI